MLERWMRRTLTAELTSDAHFGSGSGSEAIDSLVARDRHDRPVIWASHIEGVLRDAARRLRGDDSAVAFFGDAGGRRQRAVFTSLYAREQRERHIWRSTARADFDNRAPKDETLRVSEYVARGTTFVGEVEVTESDIPTLERLVQEVDSLGAGRSNGAGRVKLSLSATEVRSSDLGTSTGRLVLLLENRDPLCITATATPDNLIPTLSFVPGRALLGAVAAWLLAANESETASMLTSGKISVSDALPLPYAPRDIDHIEVLPAPLSLQSEKPEGSASELPWWAEPRKPIVRVDAWKSLQKLKRPEDDLYAFRENAGATWITYRPLRRVRLRNGRPDPKQADPSLFALEQIVEETHFRAEIHGSPDDLKKLAEKLRPVLLGQRWLRVGRSGVPVEVAHFTWANADPVFETGTTALLTLTSDLLVRDEHLRWRTALDSEALGELLGDDIVHEKSVQDSAMVHGFNGTSRLWRMPAAAVRRGSVFRISGVGIAKLAERAAKMQWLGDRTHEGFGRFRLDTDLPGVASTTTSADNSTSPAVNPEESIAEVTRGWLSAPRSLTTPSERDDRKPSLSQWFDLVGDLERGVASALSARLAPTTAGGKVWRHEGAKAILLELNRVESAQRKIYARIFVRWLRAGLKKVGP